MRTLRNPLVLVLASTLAGLILAVAFLLASAGGGVLLAALAYFLGNGGGFVLAGFLVTVLTLILMLALAAIMGVAGIVKRQPAARAAPTLLPAAGSTLTDGENPVVLVGALLGGSILAGLALLLMNGGGFLLAVLTLVLMPALAAAMGLAGIFSRQTATSAAPALQSAAAHNVTIAPAGSTLTDGENPVVLVGALLGGSVLAGLALLLMNGSGFLLAVLTLVLMLALAATMGVADLVKPHAKQEKVAPVLAARPVRTGAVSWRPAVLGLAAATALAVFSLGTMTALHGFPHTQEDLRQDFVYFGAVLLGAAALVSLFASIRQRTHMVWASGTIIAGGTAVGTATLMSCCVMTFATLFGAPALTSVGAALLVYKAPILVASITVNVLGLVPLARTATRTGSLAA